MSINSINSGEKVQLYILPHEFFTEPNFINRFAKELQRFIKKIGVNERSEIKNSLNAFYLMCDKLIQSKKDRIIAQQLFLETFLQYASHYDSTETYQNIINYYENSEFKAGLFGKFPYQAQYTYSAALFSFYQISKKVDGSNYKELANFLLSAKHRLLSIYSQFIDGKIKLKQNEVGNCLSLLSAILGELSRWFEPIYYLDKLEQFNIYNPNLRYVSVLNMDSLRDKTFLNYNGLLLLKIIDDCSLILKDPKVLKNQKEQIQILRSEYYNELRKNKLKIGDLRKHKIENKEETSKFKGIVKYCINNNLYLTEHSFYCRCNKAILDNLTVRTNHSHTNSKWCDEFEKILVSLKTDFIMARINLYNSLDGISISNHLKGVSQKAIIIEELKISCLSLSFKTCYSILDRIGMTIFKVLNIDIKKYLRDITGPDKNPPQAYFLNMWDFGVITDTHYQNNYYLISLFSLAKDLDRSEFSALKDFKNIRNELEHGSLRILNDEVISQQLKEKGYFLKKELVEKNLLLLMLTKSAIFSFTYLVRKQSTFVSN